MKYLITESQFDKIIFKYLDNQDFIQINKKNKIYFVNSKDDKFAQIRYDEVDGQCYIHHNLINEISEFFSLEFVDCMVVIGRWVENTLQMKVGNTLQMKVGNTIRTHPQARIIVVENT